MRLYHYATWIGKKINEERVIKPNRRYAEWTGQTLVTGDWPSVTFLTMNPEWEPSVQTFSRENYWEKCGSHPETNEALGIPCWKFEVNPNSLILGEVTDFKMCQDWKDMMEDARKLGSVLEEWRIAVQDCYVINAWKWENDEWTMLKNE